MIDASYSTGLLAFLIPVFAMAVAVSVLRPWMTSFVVSASLLLVSVVASLIDADGGSTVAAFALALLTLTLCGVGAVGHLLRGRDALDSKASVIYGIFVSAATVLGVFLVSGTDLPIYGCANGVDIFDGCDARFSDVSGIWLIVAAGFGAGVWWVAREADRTVRYRVCDRSRRIGRRPRLPIRGRTCPFRRLVTRSGSADRLRRHRLAAQGW